jgi:hypothetical protein
MKALNYFRQNPAIAASMIEKTYVSKGINGVYKDTNCYKNAIAKLNTQSPVKPLTESIGADLAATQHSRWIIKENNGVLTHVQTGTTVYDTFIKRIQKFGAIVGTYKAIELITSFNQEELVSANDIILHFVADCNNESKSNYAAIYQPTTFYTHAGVGIAAVGDQTVSVLIMTKAYSANPVTNAAMTAAEIEGNGNYFGNGSSQPSTSVKSADAFAHPGNEIYPGLNPANVATGNGPLGDLVNDNSVKCPTWINPANVKTDGYSRDWAATTTSCTRGTAPFTTTNNLDRVAPFAKANKCYHRLSYCSDQGKIWVKDREYLTLENVDAGASHKPTSAILKNFVNDKTVDCPSFVNGPLLRKRIVQDWYLVGITCTVGTGNFDSNGFNSPKAIAMDHKCFHRVQFCDTKGRTWVKDSEYKTLAEFRAEKH